MMMMMIMLIIIIIIIISEVKIQEKLHLDMHVLWAQHL